MRIGVDIRVLMDKYYSGISEYTANLLAAMLELDHDGQYRLFYNSYRDLSGHMNKWQRKNSQVIGLHYPNKLFNYFLQKIWSYPRLDKVLGGVDIFWSPHFNFTSLSGPKSGLKKIITVHDLSFLRYPEFFNRRKNFWHRSLGVLKTLRAADAIVAVSENTKNDIIELAGIEAAKVRVIYSGNNVIKRDWPMEKIKACLDKFGLKTPYILYVGNIEPRKNISGLIKAYEHLRQAGGEAVSGDGSVPVENFSLVLAGAPGWKNAQIYQDRKDSPYRDSINFLGYVSAEEKEILYAQAALFVYPSHYEGFGFPPLEAMAYGVPVVCSNVSSLPEVVAEAGLMVNPDKPEELAMAMEMALKDRALRNRLIAAGYLRAASFSWGRAAQEYLELFKELYAN